MNKFILIIGGITLLTSCGHRTTTVDSNRTDTGDVVVLNKDVPVNPQRVHEETLKVETLSRSISDNTRNTKEELRGAKETTEQLKTELNTEELRNKINEAHAQRLDGLLKRLQDQLSKTQIEAENNLSFAEDLGRTSRKLSIEVVSLKRDISRKQADYESAVKAVEELQRLRERDREVIREKDGVIKDLRERVGKETAISGYIRKFVIIIVAAAGIWAFVTFLLPIIIRSFRGF